MAEFHPTLGRRGLPEDKLDAKNFELDTQLMLQWASQTESGTLLRAVMNIASDDGTKLLYMSRFEGFTTSVDCSIRDGDGLAITFSSSEYLNLAKKQWGWLTEDAGNSFWMITNHKDCSKDDDPLDEYVPYLITDVDYDNLTAEFVKAERKTMHEALENFNFDFNWGEAEVIAPEAQNVAASARKQKRQPIFGLPDLHDIIDTVKDTAEDAVDTVKDTAEDVVDTVKDKTEDVVDTVKDIADGNHNREWELEFDLKPEGDAPQRMGESLLPSDKELYCIECYFKGKFKFAGHLKADKSVVPKEASFSVAPVDVKLMLKLNAKFATSEWTKTSIPVMSFPLGAINIPGIFHFGPEVSFDFDFGYEINEPLDFNFGLEGSFPNEAIVSNDIKKDHEVTFANWDKSAVGALPFELNSGAVDVRLETGPTVSLSFGFEFMGLMGYEAALRAGLPHHTAKFTSFMDEEGACEQTETANRVGINIEQGLKTDLRFRVGPSGLLQGGEQPLVDKELWKWEKDLGKSCQGVKSYADDPEFRALDDKLAELDEESVLLDEQLEELEEEIFLGEMFMETLPGMQDGLGDLSGEGKEEEEGDDLDLGTSSTIPGGWNATIPANTPLEAEELPVPAQSEVPTELPVDETFA